MVNDVQAESLIPGNEGHDSSSERVLATSVTYALKRGGERLLQVEDAKG